MVTIETIKGYLADIEKLKYDPEAAHSLEDDVREAVLMHIANGAENPKELAQEVLKSWDIDFPRWCA